jgi:hypothetical protein
MANTINLKIDVSKLDKNRLVKNNFTKRDGTVVNEVNAELVLVEKPEPRVIKEGDTWILVEKYFIAEKREKTEQPNYVGTGSQFFDKEATTGNFEDVKAMREQHNANLNSFDDIDPSLIPF